MIEQKMIITTDRQGNQVWFYGYFERGRFHSGEFL